MPVPLTPPLPRPSTPAFHRYILLEHTTIPNPSYKYQALYFYTAWCASCLGENNAYYYNAHKIHDLVQVVRVSFDKEVQLKTKYQVIHQGATVLINQEQTELSRWLGGGVEKPNQVVESLEKKHHLII